MARPSLEPVAQVVRAGRDDAAMLARLARDLPRFLRRPLLPEEARESVRHDLENREQRFLTFVDLAVYGPERSPYRRLLDHAGCERGDLRTLVLQEGIEGALRRLVDAGVYVTFDEFKGRRPIVRGSLRVPISDRDFDSPLAPYHFPTLTGGSRGRPSRVRRSLSLVTDGASAFSLALQAHGVRRPRAALWLGGSPGWCLIYLKLGLPVVGWLQPVRHVPLAARIGAAYLSLLVRLAGHRLPAPRYCDLTAPETVVRRLTSWSTSTRPLVLNTTTSSAVRVAVAASALGRSLAGVTFHCRSEPLTLARRSLIEQAGAGAVVDFGSIELPYVAFGCATPDVPDDTHLFTDRYAAIERRRAVGRDGPTIDALLLTSLSPATAKVALNVELGDSARVTQRDCDCALGALRLRTHLSEIRSFEKLSTEGTSFARSDLTRILEEVLPARFGGTPLDYQLVEEETATGATLLILRAAPSIGDLDATAVRTALLNALGAGDTVDAYQARLIRRAESLVVRRAPPLATRAGKVLPLHLRRYAADPD